MSTAYLLSKAPGQVRALMAILNERTLLRSYVMKRLKGSAVSGKSPMLWNSPVFSAEFPQFDASLTALSRYFSRHMIHICINIFWLPHFQVVVDDAKLNAAVARFAKYRAINRRSDLPFEITIPFEMNCRILVRNQESYMHTRSS